ncbi:MAG: hypothetical protein QNJ22_18630 [Desulfosarcinaceae bacterium]|nr:hypothetical protein [Desulfosarcinaceae bacterium]
MRRSVIGIAILLAVVLFLFLDPAHGTEPCEPLAFKMAKGMRSRTLIVAVEEARHHIGDGGGAEGLTWEKTFRLPRKVKSYGGAYVTFCANNLEMSNLIVNGNVVAIPTFNYSYDGYVNRVIALPASFFNPGDNSIGFESLYWPNGNYDDFWFEHMVLYFK